MHILHSETKAGALQILAKYNDNPIDLSAMKLTFEDIYNRWAEEKCPTISPSNVNGYTHFEIEELIDAINKI